MKHETHIIVEFPSNDTDLLYRASDGMALACRQGLTVISGADPNPAKKDHRNFIDKTFATMYLRKLADADAEGLRDGGNFVRDCASFDVRNGEPRIVPANESKVLGFKN